MFCCMKRSWTLEMASNIEHKKFALNVRRDGPQPSIFVRRFSAITNRPWRRPGRLLAQQGGEPRLIEPHLLARRFPECTDLLGLAPGRKGRGSHTQQNEVFEVVGFGITPACLPVPHRLP